MRRRATANQASQGRRWWHAGIAATAGATAVYTIGTYHRFVWNIEAVCSVSHGQRFDVETMSSDRWFPISQRCNADFDLVPAFVNPTIVAFAGLAVVCFIVAMVLPHVGVRAVPVPTGE